MALPATDAFTGTTGDQLTTYSSNWTLNNGDFDIQSNELAPDDSVDADECAAHWNADTFAADQYVKWVWKTLSSSAYIGGGGRMSTDASENYLGWYANNSGNTFAFVVIATTWTQKGSTASALVSANDTGEGRITGASPTTADFYHNDSFHSGLSFTDSTLSGGAVGVNGFNDGLTTIDDWEGGDLGAVSGLPAGSLSLLGVGI